MSATTRPYRQVARAAATQDTQRRIVAAFREALLAHWMDEITLDDVAAAAGTTRQTVIRLFGGKEALITAAADAMKEEIEIRRALPPKAKPQAVVRAVVGDYEVSGDVIVRLLAQEDRHPALTALLTVGRKWHRQWVEQSFATPLADLSAKCRERRVTQLVVATDVYTWKLLRRDFRHSVTDVEALITGMVQHLLEEKRNDQ